jgi:hypothetical protein
MMIEWASEPTAHPESKHLQDAIEKGLGRALFWAKKGLWTDKAILLNACLHDLRYDRQCEESRGPWLWQIMGLLGVVSEFRDAILDSLRIVDDGFAGHQLCQFCVYYARDGDERFRQRLREIVTRKPDPSYPSFGERELIDLDGEAGFLFAARIRSEALSSREWDWEDGHLIEEAIEKLGEPAVLALLDRESQSSPAMLRFHDAWRAAVQLKTDDPRQKHIERMRQYSLTDIIQRAESERSQVGILRGWGMYADEADLRIILDRLLNVQDPAILVNYLQVFSNRPMPEPNEKLLGLLDHEDKNVRFRAYTALAQNSHSLVRKYAVDHLNDRIAEPNFLKLFIRNLMPGDEETLLGALRLPEDEYQCHGFLMDLLEVLEHNPESKCYELAMIIYRFTPCGNCRRHAAKLLINRKVAPAWLIEECRYDAIADTRCLVAIPAVET